MKARIKTINEIESIIPPNCDGGYHLKGQFLPKSMLVYCGKIIDVFESFKFTYHFIDENGEYMFISEEALEFLND